MGREPRRVPPDWQHPIDARGSYDPLFEPGRPVAEIIAEYDREKAQWESGAHPDQLPGGLAPGRDPKECSWEKWHGHRPLPEHYMPFWPAEQATHWQMYETCTEGAPISPVFATPEELARWLANNGASAFADQTSSYEQWLKTILRGGSIGSFMITGDGFISGVDA